MTEAPKPLEEEQSLVFDYFAAFKRRKILIVSIFLVVASLVTIYAMTLPASYQSEATILIEEQEVPIDFVRSTLTNYADQQIQLINRRLMTVETISGIADKFELYRNDEGDPPPNTVLAKRFARDMNMELVSAQVVDPRSGRASRATIAFTLSYTHSNPSVAQKVTNELVTLFLNENLRTRAVKASSTAEFLAAESNSIRRELSDIEEEISRFKSENEGSLPELYKFNLSVVERSERALTNTNFRLQELAKRQIRLESELAQTQPTVPRRTASGAVILGVDDQLEMMMDEQRRLVSTYTENHPDVQAIERDIERLKERLAEDPDVGRGADNPAYVMLQTQLHSARLETKTLEDKQGEIRARIEEHEALIRRAPEVEKEYLALLREQKTTSQKYQELKAKQREAILAISLEDNRKGQRFELIEPPSLPISPVKPNRKAIVLLGLFLAFGAGGGAAWLRESFDEAVYGERAVESLLGTTLIGVVPYLDNQDAKRKSRWLWLLLIPLLLVVALIFVHFAVKPLDLFYLSVLQQLGLA